jgi:rod shape-determining protein MreD
MPVVVITALVVHTSVLSHLRVAGVAPDVMLLVAVAGGIVGGPTRGAVVGFAAGLAIDLFLQGPLGLSALVFCLVGYAVGNVSNAVLRAAWWIPLLTTLLASAGGELLYALAATMVGGGHLITLRLPVVMGLVAVTNCVLAVVVVRLVEWAMAEPGAARVGLP